MQIYKPEDFRNFIKRQCGGRSTEVDALFDQLNPVFLAEETDESFTFRAIRANHGEHNIVRMGLKASIRLQAQCFASGVILSVVAHPDHESFTEDDQRGMFAPAEQMMNWANASDIRRCLPYLKDVPLDQIIPNASETLDDELIHNLTDYQKRWCWSIYSMSLAFVILHELAHLRLQHEPSPQSEFEADRFAAMILMEAAAQSDNPLNDQLIVATGVMMALLWASTYNVFVGPDQCATHPQSSSRLYHLLETMLEPMPEVHQNGAWSFLFQILFMHMQSAGFTFDDADAPHMEGSSKDSASYLIDRVSRGKKTQ